MKAVVVHSKASAVEKSWSNQYAGLDAETRKEFDGIADFDKRVKQVFTIQDLTWDSIVQTMTSAAQAAGQDGVVVIASGHGARIPHDTFGGMVNWDPTEHNVDKTWNDENKVGSGLFWDEVTTIYTTVISQFSNPPTRQKEDQASVAGKKSNAKLAQKRLDAFDAYDKIGKALKAAGVRRLTFTVCCFGEASGFVDRIASNFGIEVAAFTENTVVFDEFTSFKITPSKARMVIEGDAKIKDQKSNTRLARVNSPDLDDNSIAYVGGKKKTP